MAEMTRSRVLDTAKGMLLFVAIGPPTGSLVVIAFFLLTGESQGQLPSVTAVLGLSFMIAVFSYPIGAIPAAATGLIAGLTRHELNQTRRCFRVGVLGGLLAILVSGPLFFYKGVPLSPVDIAVYIVILGFPGFLGATVCALLLRARPIEPAARFEAGGDE